MNPDVVNIKSGNLQVKSVYSGEEKVWPQSFIDVKPKYLFSQIWKVRGLLMLLRMLIGMLKLNYKRFYYG